MNEHIQQYIFVTMRVVKKPYFEKVTDYCGNDAEQMEYPECGNVFFLAPVFEKNDHEDACNCYREDKADGT